MDILLFSHNICFQYQTWVNISLEKIYKQWHASVYICSVLSFQQCITFVAQVLAIHTVTQRILSCLFLDSHYFILLLGERVFPGLGPYKSGIQCRWAPNEWWFFLQFLNFTRMQKWHTFSGNHISSFACFPPSYHCGTFSWWGAAVSRSPVRGYMGNQGKVVCCIAKQSHLRA